MLKQSTLAVVGYAFLVALLAYVLMKMLLRQSNEVALQHSAILGAIVFVYILAFGY